MDQSLNQLINQLDYSNLASVELVPDLRPFIKPGSKRYPTWVYRELKVQLGSKNLDCFNKFMINLIQMMIIDLNWIQQAYPTFLKILKQFSTVAKIDQITFSKSIPKFKNMASIYQSAFSKCKDEINFNQVIKSEGLIGQTNISTNHCVIQIKTVTSLKSKADQYFLEILANLAISRKSGGNHNYVGLLLPLQNDLLMVDLHGWKSDKFFQILKDRLSVMLDKENPFQMISQIEQAMIGVGCTLSRRDKITSRTISILKCLTQYLDILNRPNSQGSLSILPGQIFLHGNQSATIKIIDQEITEINNLIENTKLPIYVHAPYTINPSKPWTKKDPKDQTWGIRLLRDQLSVSRAMGFRGVIFHIGKSMELSISEGLDRMEGTIRSVLDQASEQCPLMLETPVGAGTELCHRIEDLSKFYSRFNRKNIFKICIDTCHVFVAGYDPFEYIKDWAELQGVDTIGLVHFNDSRNKFGCRADGHAPCGQGNIGARKLGQISTWCRKRKIPMVTE